MYGHIYVQGMEHYRSRVRQNLDVVPRGNSRPALVPRTSANQKPASRNGVSTPCGAVSAPRSPFYLPRYWSCRYMERLMIWGWDIIVPGCGGTSALFRVQRVGSPRAGFMIPSRSPDGGGISTPCGAISTRGVAVFAPVLLDLWIYGRIPDPGTDSTIPPPEIKQRFS